MVISKSVSKPIVIGALCTVLVSSGVGVYVWREEHRPHVLEIYVIPLKTGQALFIRTPDDKRILVDGGVNSEIVRAVSSILPFYTRRIDTVIVTRPDGNHVAGLVDIIDRYHVHDILIPAVTLESLGLASSSDQIYATFLDIAKEKHVHVREVVVGERLVFDRNTQSRNQVIGHILFPAVLGDFVYSKASAPELVMDIEYGRTHIMNIGTITPKIQKFLASSPATTSSRGFPLGDSQLDVLIAAKSPTPSNLAPKFFDQVQPHTLIYSKAIKKTDPIGSSSLDRINIRERGVVKITSDGNGVSISFPHL